MLRRWDVDCGEPRSDLHLQVPRRPKASVLTSVEVSRLTFSKSIASQVFLTTPYATVEDEEGERRERLLPPDDRANLSEQDDQLRRLKEGPKSLKLSSYRWGKMDQQLCNVLRR